MTDKTTRPRFTIAADQLLRVLSAVTPLAGKDIERPHLTQLRFETFARKDELEVAATDGRCLGKVTVPILSCGESTIFCLQAQHVPTVVKMLGRLDSKTREETEVSIEIGRSKMNVVIADASVFLPRTDEQLDFPELERVIPPSLKRGDKTAPKFGISPDLMAKVSKCAGQVAYAVVWSSPKSPLEPVRLDVVEAIAVGIRATFAIAPMRVDLEKQEDKQDERQLGGLDAQT